MPAVHARQTLRAAIKTLLTGLETTGARVHCARVRPVQSSELPCLLIYSREEVAASGKMGGYLDRNWQLVVEGIADDADAEALENTLDTIAAEVEAKIGEDSTLGGVVHNAQLERTDWEYSGEGARPVGRIGLGFRIEYETSESEPGTLA